MLLVLIILSGIAIFLGQTETFSALGVGALPVAIIMGILYGNIFNPKNSQKDEKILRFSQQKLLRFGIILFGFNLSLFQIVNIGWTAFLIDSIVIVSILTLGIWLGVRYLHIPYELAILTSIGSAVCGAAAVLAAEQVVKAKPKDVSIAVATVVLFGTLAMLVYPLIYYFSSLDQANFGVYIGSTVHEVAQAVAAGGMVGGEAQQNALVTKLIRVVLLAPVVIVLSYFLVRKNKALKSQKIQWPFFIVGFIIIAAINSLNILSERLVGGFLAVSQFSLAMAMVSLGIKTKWQIAKEVGFKPFLLALILFLVLLIGGYLLNITTTQIWHI